AGRAAPLRQAANVDDVLERRLPHANLITDLNHLRPLRARAIDVHFAAVNGVRSQAASLEEPGGPEPFVETDAIAVFGFAGAHTRILACELTGYARRGSRPTRGF